MGYMIRIYRGETIVDIPFSKTGFYYIGGAKNDDYFLGTEFPKKAIQLFEKNGVLHYNAFELKNAPRKGEVEPEKIYVIDEEKVAAFACYDPGKVHLQTVDVTNQTEFVIGRAKDCNIRIDSQQITKHHARFVHTANGWEIIDLNSANGTYVNGSAITRAVLKDTDIIDIAFCQIKLSENTVRIRFSGSIIPLFSKPAIWKPYEENGGYPFSFKRSPRMIRNTVESTIEIESAPAIGTAPSINWGSVLISPLLSVVIMVLMVTFFDFSMTSLFFSAPMAIVGVILAILNFISQKKKHRLKEESRQIKYQSYLNDIKDKIHFIHDEQRSVLLEMHPSTQSCMHIVEQLDRALWSKRYQDKDFMNIRVGIGKVPAKLAIHIPHVSLSLENDTLSKYPSIIQESAQWVMGCPITVDLLNNPTLGIIGNRRNVLDIAKNIIVQATSLHSYDELKIVTICNSDEYSEWEFVKWLPHSFNETRTQRFMATTESSGTDFLGALDELVIQRQRESGSKGDVQKISTPSPYYLFVFANYNMIKEHSLLKHIAEIDSGTGIGCVFLFDELYYLPKECNLIIEATNKVNRVYPRENATNVAEFSIDLIPKNQYEKFARQMAPIRIDNGAQNILPLSVSFLRGYNIKRPKECDLEHAWNLARPYETMAVPIGVRSNGEQFFFDIHEKKHGPHGIVAGTTGSGKSETVQTWILSMALHFSPDDVSFVLVDFKGTGLILPFKNLPHLAGSISDLDTSIDRNLIALENELTRRKNLLDVNGVRDISDYKKLYALGKVTEPLSYLFIVIDEFAEFKAQFPEFMPVVNRLYATGRTLGVHVILLTQKPTNAITETISANTRFRWCLKVASSGDSQEMLERPDAAKITNPGRVIIKIGEFETYETIQSFYSGAPYNPHASANKNNLESIAVVNLDGRRSIYEPEKTTGFRSAKHEIDAVVEHLDEFVRETKRNRARSIWTQKLPETVYLSQLLTIAFDGERWATGEQRLHAPIGMVDNPRVQTQYPLDIDLTRDGNLAVFGAPGTGKSSFVQTAILSFALSYSPKELQMYGMDFGGGNMRLFSALPHIGDICVADEAEKIIKLAKMLDDELLHRKKIFSECGVMSLQACRELSSMQMPYIILLLDNFAPVLNEYPQLEDFFIRFSREGATYGLYWIVTANTINTLTFKINQNFKNMIALCMADPSDYVSIVGKTNGFKPENYPGRGLVKDTHPLEFQTALPAEGKTEIERMKALRELIQLMDSKWTGERPKGIPDMPNHVSMEMLSGVGVAVGLAIGDVQRLAYDPAVNPFVTVSLSTKELENPMIAAMLKQYSELCFEQMIVFKGKTGYQIDSTKTKKTINSPEEFDSVIEELMPVMQERKNLKTNKPDICFDPIIVFLSDIKACFEKMSDKSATRVNLLLTLGRNLDVMLVGSGFCDDISTLYYGGASFVVNLVNTGIGIALGGRLRSHEAFKTELPFSEQDMVLNSYEGYYVQNKKATRFKAIDS